MKLEKGWQFMCMFFFFRNKVKKERDFNEIIADISIMFAGTDTGNFEENVNKAIKMVGDYEKTDRVYIFRYDFIENVCSNTFEYCQPGISKEIDNLQDIPLEGIPDWVETHVQNELMYIPNVSNLLPNNRVRQILEPQNVKSLMTVPLFIGETLYGFLGFDSILKTKVYSATEQKMIEQFASLLVNLISRIEVEQDLVLQRKRTEYVIQASKIGVWEWDLKTDRTIFNENWAKMLGYTLEELEPHTIETWKKHTHPEDLVNAQLQIKRLLSGETQVYESTQRMFNKQGDIVWVRDTGGIFKSEEGRPTVLLGSHVNISELKRQEWMLDIIGSATEQLPIGLALISKEEEVIYGNNAFYSLLETNAEQLLGKPVDIFKSRFYSLNEYEAVLAELRNNRAWTGDVEYIKNDGKKAWASLTLTPVKSDDGKNSYFSILSYDITERKKRSEAYEKERQLLHQNIQVKATETEEAQKAVVLALAKLTEARDYETGEHVERVQYLCRALAATLRLNPKYEQTINQDFLDDIFFASALHDLGKIRIPDQILLKPGKLTTEEFEIIKRHVSYGSEILAEMARRNPQNRLIMGTRIAKYHHERFDGSGYLEGLQGEQIPIEARIMALVDVYDALRSSRPYKKPIPHAEVKKMILEESGKHFDPDVIGAFLEISHQFEVIYDSMKG